MELNHLSDEQIQNYLDNLESNDKAEIENHLQHCPRCTRNLQIYKEMYHHLGHNSIPNLSKHFPRLVMAKIIVQQEKKTYFWENLSFIILLLFAAAGSSYLINPLPLWQSMVKPLLIFINKMMGQIPPQLNNSWPIITAGIIILVFYEFLTGKIMKPKA
jgi:hypothetical protein